MNAHRHRLVFNRARGLLMAVAETACAQGKSPANAAQQIPLRDGVATRSSAGPAPHGPTLARLRPAAFATLLALGAQLAIVPLAQAQVVAYKAAPANQRPTILTAGNGVPLVNIPTPSAAGVSHAVYESLNVAEAGLIFNNSRTNALTQLGGWVQGNPWLARGSARVILNEVISANPSQLLGYIEVAGSPAQVVIANPAGVTCNGCGFINASRATLTTGTPVVSGGNLDGYRVEGGSIRVDGAGMDASRVGYTDLIARAVEVNAGLWAQTLKVTAGANVVDADNSQATPITGSGAAPAFAIDVAQLGGMYAGKIVLVGTEAGVGVRNAGYLGASAGEVVVTADGRLTNSGSLIAAGNVGVDARAGVANTGTVYAQGDLGFATAGDIENSGGLVAAGGNATLAASGAGSRISGDTDSIFAAGMASDGSLGATGNLAMSATEHIAAHGRQLAGGDLAMSARSLDLADSTNNAQNVALTASAGDLDLSRATTVASGTLTARAAKTLIHEAARTSAEGDVILIAGKVLNHQGRIGAGGALSVESAAGIDNSDGLLFAAGALSITAANLDNRNGALQAAENVTVQASGAIDNRSGLIRSGKTVALTAASTDNAGTLGTDQGIEGQSVSLTARDIGNAGGALRATANLTLAADRSIDNTGGLLSAGDTLAITDSSAVGRNLAIANAGGSAPDSPRGTMIADKRIAIDAASLAGQGEILGLQDVDVKLTRDTVHSGRLVANRNLRFETAGTLDNSGLMEAGNALTVTAGTLNNAATGTLKGKALQLTATDINTLTNRGLINGTDTRIDTVTLNNLGTGRIYGDTVSIAATTLTNAAEAINGITQAPVIAARNRLDLGVTTLANRDGALIFSAGDLAIGASLDTNRRATGRATNIENTSAGIESIRDLVIDASRLTNQRRTLTIAREVYQEDGASSRSWRRCDNPPKCSYWTDMVETTTQYLDKVTASTPAATIRAGRHATLSVGDLTNRYSTIEAGGDLVLTGNTLTNEGAELYRRTDVETKGHRWHYKNGLKDHGTFVDVSSTSALADTVPAIISAGGTLTGSYTDRIDNVAIRQATAPTAAGSGTKVPAIAVGRAGSGAGRIGRVPVGSGQSVVSANPDLSVPENSLFRSAPEHAHYVKETDPAFANHRQWLSSDYMLRQLALDPATSQKRLGDGFYEQRLITEQIAQLTGRRFLTGYQNDETQYQALMEAGTTFAKTWQLIPGIALSAEQMARLTTDMVWLVEKEVAGQKVLVPQVYARVQDGDLAPSGALLAGAAVNLDTAADLINSGRIAGRQVVSLSAENIRNLGGDVTGKEIFADARKDLQFKGGAFTAENRLIARAGRDLTVESSTVDLEYRVAGVNGSVRRTDISRVAGLYVTGDNGTLVASAGNDLSLLAAALVNGNPTAAGPAGGTTATTVLAAGNKLTLGTVTESRDAATSTKKTRWSESASSEVGTSIQSAGDLTLTAGNDLKARAATVQSGGALDAAAGNDLKIESGEARSASDYTRKSSSGGFLSKKRTTIHNASESTTAIASTFSGDSVTLTANRDVAVKGSNVVATKDTTLVATRDLLIEAATETHSETREKSTKQSGVFSSGGVGFTVGSRQNSSNQTTETTTAAKSTIGSTDGNVILSAGNRYRQVGSDVIAPKGDIGISAKSVDIVEARETSRTTTETKSKQSGLTIAVTSPVISAIQTVQQMSEAAGNTKDGRMQVLAAANVALATKNAANAVIAGQGTTINGKEGQIATAFNDKGEAIAGRDATAVDQIGGVNLSISIGGSKSSSKTTQTSDTAAASSLTAGRDINIAATGAGKDSDLTIQGSKATAIRDIALTAEDEIRLLAAANTAGQKSTNKNSSGSVGISFGSDGLLLNVGASAGRGKADGDDLTWTNTHVEAGNRLTLESGGGTTLKGAVAKGEQVVAKIGGDLNIESLQDTSTYDSKQQSLGGSVSVGYGRMSGSVSASGSKVKSDYASVAEQTAIRAGDGGFQVEAKGDTDLKGGAITSTQKAIDAPQETPSGGDSKNSFHTGGTLTTSDIQNKAEYSAKSVSVNVGTSLSFNGALKPGGTSAGFGKDGDKAESMTLAAISDIAGNKTARTGDAETGIQKIFDQEKVQKEIDAQTRITQQFGQLASKAVGDYAQTKTNEAKALRELAKNEPDESRASQLKAQAAEIDSQWGETGTLRLAAHTVIGGLTGGASGAAGAAAGTLTAPLVAKALAKANIDGPLATALTGAASTAVGAAVGGTAGGSAALNEVANNYLSHQEIKRKGDLQKAIAECKATGKTCASLQAELNELEKTDRARDALLDACQGVSSATCNNARQEVRNFAAEIVRKGSADVIIGSDGRHTIREATGTMSGGKLLFETGKGTLSAIVDGYVDTLKMLADAVKNPAGAAEALREQTQQAKETVQWAAENPEKFKEIAQAAEQRLRDGLAEALKAGDEKQVGLLLGAVLANFTPDPAKKAQAALHLIDEIALAKKAETLAKRSDIDNVRNVPTGTKGNWSADANGKLEPKTGYLLDNGHAYITDAQGRVKTVEADLNGIRMDRNGYQQSCVGKCGDAGDEGGHLIAAILGGAGDRLNIVPQSQTLNRGEWRTMEKYLKQELDAGKSVTMKVEVGYPQGGGARPSEFLVTAVIDGKIKKFPFMQ